MLDDVALPDMNFSDGLTGKEQEDALKELISAARNMNKAPLDVVSKRLVLIFSCISRAESTSPAHLARINPTLSVATSCRTNLKDCTG